MGTDVTAEQTTTLAEDLAALVAAAEELKHSALYLASRGSELVVVAERVCHRAAAEQPELAKELAPMVDGFRALASQLEAMS